MTAEQANQAKRERNRQPRDNRKLPAVIEHGGEVASVDQPSDEHSRKSRKLGTAVALASIGLGIAEIVAPRFLSRAIGIRPNAVRSTVMRLCGLREIVVGVGMLVQPERARWAWARVAEDALDVALLYRMSKGRRNNRGLVTASMVVTTGALALDVLRARQLEPSRNFPRIRRAARGDRDTVQPSEVVQGVV